MKRRIGSAYDEIRNRQLAAIWDDEYVKPINRRAYGLEKEQYIKVYPDANTQLHKPELPQQLQYNFDIACDKFSSQLMHFVSLIENSHVAFKNGSATASVISFSLSTMIFTTTD